jgi:hypothetical protein
VSQSVSLESLIGDVGQKCASTSNGTSNGWILIMEDINPAIMRQLGSTFDVEPLFFAGYIATKFKAIEKYRPPLYVTILPSQVATPEYTHLHYQRPVKLGRAPYMPSAVRLETQSNVRRVVQRLAPLDDIEISLIRSCCALLRKQFESGSWLCKSSRTVQEK